MASFQFLYFSCFALYFLNKMLGTVPEDAVKSNFEEDDWVVVLYDEEKYPGEVVKIKVRVILRHCRISLGLRPEIKLGRSLFKVLYRTWHIINTRCILPFLLCILKLKNYSLLFSPNWKWCTQFLEWKSSGTGPRNQTKFGTSPSKEWLRQHPSHWHVAEEQGQGLSLLEKISRTCFHDQKYFRITFVFCWCMHLVHRKCVTYGTIWLRSVAWINPQFSQCK